MVEHKTFGFFMIILMLFSLGLMIGIGIFIISIAKQTGNCARFNESKEIQICCDEWAKKTNISININKCFGEWKIKENKCYYECINQIQNTPPMPYLEKECERISSDKIQSCCEEWAKKNNIINPACIGKWTIQAGWCIWECEK